MYPNLAPPFIVSRLSGLISRQCGRPYLLQLDMVTIIPSWLIWGPALARMGLWLRTIATAPIFFNTVSEISCPNSFPYPRELGCTPGISPGSFHSTSSDISVVGCLMLSSSCILSLMPPWTNSSFPGRRAAIGRRL